MYDTFGFSSKRVEKQILREHYWFRVAAATVIFADYQSFQENLPQNQLTLLATSVIKGYNFVFL